MNYNNTHIDHFVVSTSQMTLFCSELGPLLTPVICGTNYPSDAVQTVENDAYLRFQTDSSGSSTGFKITWTASEDSELLFIQYWFGLEWIRFRDKSFQLQLMIHTK